MTWRSKIIVALAALSLCAIGDHICYAQEKSTSPTSGGAPTDKELEQMWNETTQKDPQGWARTVLESQEDLAKFGYGTLFTAKLDEKTKAALRAYQGRNNLPVNGNLDISTWTQMQHDSAALRLNIPLGPLYMFNDSDWDNVFTVEGVWLEQGKEPSESTPLRAARIECFRANRTCIAATRGETLIHFQYLDVDRWDRDEIVTRPDDLPCGREYIQIVRPRKAVLSINTAVYKDKDACTKLFGLAGEPTVSRLGDSGKIRDARLRAHRAASDRILVLPAEVRSPAGLKDH